ncbi:MAG: elongation factor G [Myxococcota bacterium]
MTIARQRNIGISAHIDAGKTTLSERILFYCGRIHRMQEVRDRRGGGAVMDSLDVEQRRGITVQSAATRVAWGSHAITLIDTPGHVDFTIEVERALSVLDGAVLVLCAKNGVQAQTRTVVTQMQRYEIPCIAFINKMDSVGADPARVVSQLRTRLGLHPLVVATAVGKGKEFTGIVDLVHRQLVQFDGEHGELVVRSPWNADAELEAQRRVLIESVADVDDTLAEAYLADEAIDPETLVAAIRRATLTRRATPVLLGSAYRNKGVQPLLDAVVNYLPSPKERMKLAHHQQTNQPITLEANPALPLAAYVFKIERGRYGQLSYARVYQGTLRKGMRVRVAGSGTTLKIGRIVRMHADTMEDIATAEAGDIVALFGLEASHGALLSDPRLPIELPAAFVPEPVVQYAITPKENTMLDKLSRALGRFAREDPTLQITRDPESGETLVAGMGELHLEVYVERMRDESGVEVELGPPQVAYREAPTKTVDFDVLYKKQDGGAGAFARVVGRLGPASDGAYSFASEIRGGTVPREYVEATDRGFADALARGVVVGAPVEGLHVVLTDGAIHRKDSSDQAFRIAARMAFRDAMRRAEPVVLEPIMTVQVITPELHLGQVHAALVRRRGRILGTETGATTTVDAAVPLAEMFDFSAELRAVTRGQGAYTMEFASRQPVPRQVQARLAETLGHRALK